MSNGPNRAQWAGGPKPKTRKPNSKETIPNGPVVYPHIGFAELRQEEGDIPRVPREEAIESINASFRVRA